MLSSKLSPTGIVILTLLPLTGNISHIAARHTPPSGDCPESREPVSLMVGKPEGSSNGWAANDLSQIGQQYLPPVARLTLESGNGAWGSVRAE